MRVRATSLPAAVFHAWNARRRVVLPKLVRIGIIANRNSLVFFPATLPQLSRLPKKKGTQLSPYRFATIEAYIDYISQHMDAEVGVLVRLGALPLFNVNEENSNQAQEAANILTNFGEGQGLVLLKDTNLLLMVNSRIVENAQQTAAWEIQGKARLDIGVFENAAELQAKLEKAADPGPPPALPPPMIPPRPQGGAVTEIGTKPVDAGWAVGVSDTGPSREENQDCFLIYEPQIPHAAKVLAIADGAGGHLGGGNASNRAVLTANTLLGSGRSSSDPITPEEIKQAFVIANNAICEEAQREPDKLRGMATTMDVVVIQGNVALGAHVGDSRVYHVTPNGTVSLLTRDHHYSTLWVENELRTKHTYPLSGQALLDVENKRRQYSGVNIITKALGSIPPENSAREFTVDQFYLTLQAGDWLLLNCDGVSDKLLARLVTMLQYCREKSMTIQQAQRFIMQEALRVTSDNTTLILYEHPKIPEVIAALHSPHRKEVVQVMDEILTGDRVINPADVDAVKARLTTLAASEDKGFAETAKRVKSFLEKPALDETPLPTLTEITPILLDEIIMGTRVLTQADADQFCALMGPYRRTLRQPGKEAVDLALEMMKQEGLI